MATSHIEPAKGMHVMNIHATPAAGALEVAVPDHPPVPAAKIGVLVVNLGTPTGTDYWSMRRYLGQFLSDRRVIEVPPLIWQPILNLAILSFRPQKSGHAYKAIWFEDTNESPLRRYTRAQAEGLAKTMGDIGRPIVIDWAMRYGEPSIDDRMEALRAQGCSRILVFALYPQYSASTSATAYDNAFRALAKMRWQPAVRTAPPYHDDPLYIDAIATSIERHLSATGFKPERLVASFHGLPQSYLEKGDPYHCHCAKTTRLLKARLAAGGHLAADDVVMTFQSRFGPQEWLKPYTEQTVRTLAKEGIRRIAIVTPGFSSDCVETLEEISIGVREAFFEDGGEAFEYIPCLNDSDLSIGLIDALVRRELQGWI